MPTKRSSQIKLLPEHLIDQIKAGEVVERPASLLKELIENSVDAGATSIQIHLIAGGLELLAIEDNGQGMGRADLPYAFARHATSKITRFEDLYNLSSFGFRGEALASAASISRLTCTSTPRNNPEDGGKIVLHGGMTVEEAPFRGSEAGTSFFIRDLFYNTPARLKFIKSKTSEKNALKRIFFSALLSHPEIEFSIKWDDSDRKRYPAASLAARAREVLLGKKSSPEDICSFSGLFDGTKVTGFASLNPELGQRTQQYLFVNQRLFTDRALHQVILASFAPVWLGTGAPYAVFIEVPPSEIDVNVHPNKTQVKFFKMGQVIGVLKESIKLILPSMPAPEKESEQPSKQGQEAALHYPSTSLGEKLVAAPENSLGTKENSLLLAQEYLLLENQILISLKRFSPHLRSHFLSHQEGGAIPLLIAKAFPRPQGWGRKDEDYYETKCYEWEQIGTDKIALKTVPAKLGPYPPHLVAQFLLSTSHDNETLQVIALLARLYFENQEAQELPPDCWLHLSGERLEKLFNDDA